MIHELRLPLWLQGFLSAALLFAYVVLVVFIMNHGEVLLPSFGDLTTGVFVILLFVLSATFSGSVVLAKPAVLFYERRYYEAFVLLGSTVLSGFILLLVYVIFLNIIY